MTLTREQYELRYTKQRIIKALTDEPYHYTSIAAVRKYTTKHSDERFEQALNELITEGMIERRENDHVELGWRWRAEQREKEKKAAAAERAKKKAAREARKAERLAAAEGTQP